MDKLTKEVEEKDRELVAKSQALEEAKKQKGEVNKRLLQINQTIRQTQTMTMKLIQEKMEIGKKLQLREQELQFLCTGHQKDSKQLQNIISNKEVEIRELQQQLHTVESKLTLEKNLSKELRQKLQQATEELAKKSAVEKEREEAKEYLKTHLERERQAVDSLRVQLTSKDQYIREVEVMRHIPYISLVPMQAPDNQCAHARSSVINSTPVKLCFGGTPFWQFFSHNKRREAA